MAMINSFLLYKKAMIQQNLIPLRHYHFRQDIINHLLAPLFKLNENKNSQFIFNETDQKFHIKKKKEANNDSCRLVYT